jgi:hypothetical protein
MDNKKHWEICKKVSLLDTESKEMLSFLKALTTIGLMKISEFLISVCLKMKSRRLMDSMLTIDLLT